MQLFISAWIIQVLIQLCDNGLPRYWRFQGCFHAFDRLSISLSCMCFYGISFFCTFLKTFLSRHVNLSGTLKQRPPPSSLVEMSLPWHHSAQSACFLHQVWQWQNLWKSWMVCASSVSSLMSEISERWLNCTVPKSETANETWGRV